MKAEVVTVSPVNPDLSLMERAGNLIKHGGLVAFPTETVYGLGGNALDPEASRKIYAAKGRPSDNPLIVHIAQMEDLFPLVGKVPEKALQLAKAYWPGPLTMIFPKTALVPYETTGGLDTVAVRFPSHPVAKELILASGGYVAAPSANRSGRPSPTTAAHVVEDLGETIDMILDGGSAQIGLESTIVDFTVDVATILRPGYISLEMLRDCIGEGEMDRGLSASSKVRPKAPGMKYRHYAPKAEMTVVEGAPEKVEEKIRSLAAVASSSGKKVGIFATREHADAYPQGQVRLAGSLLEEDGIARHLYENLRLFDEEGVDVIYSEAFDTPLLGQAIMNRLLKAAGQKVLRV